MHLELLVQQYKDNKDSGTEFIHHLLYECMKEVGNTDPFIRDQLAFNTFAQCMIDENIDNNVLDDLVYLCIGNLNINNSDICDDIFKRSFSVLFLMSILYRDNIRHLLTHSQLRSISKAVIEYFINEKDTRGFVHRKGWAHGIAHASDAIIEVIKNRNYDESFTLTILEGIKVNLFKLQNNDMPYIDDEDERMSGIIEVLLKYRRCHEDLIIHWINSLDILDKLSGNQDIAYYRKLKNIKDFKKSLYFIMDDYPNVQHIIKSSL
ncbi:DUF2785 domain-containing protein [Macrococcus animalis]|uniref:DUF2785 domain-containing protein n=1 Tax=Macrococcus animalis TaxID=3395467 RepID=UPI0039BE056D